MAEQVMEDIEKDLHCSICMNRFQTPKMLPCIHSFCEGCLVKYVKQLRGKEFACPTCRRVCELPSGVKGLQTNFHFVNLGEKVDLYKKLEPSKASTISCGICEDSQNKLKVFCVECDLTICSKCKGQHSRFPALRSHELIPLGGDGPTKLQTVVKKSGFPCCTLHTPAKLRFFCNTCFELICRECTVVQHPKPGHNCVEAPTEFQNVKMMLNGLLRKSESQLQQTSEYINTGTAGKEKLTMESQLLLKKVADTHEEIQSAVENQLKIQMESARKKVLKTQKSKVVAVDSSIQQAENWVSSMKNTQAVVTNVIKEDSMWELLSMSNNLKCSFDELQSEMGEFKWDKSDLELEITFVREETPQVEFGTCISTSEADLSVVMYDRGRRGDCEFIICQFDKAKSVLNITKVNKSATRQFKRFSIGKIVSENVQLTACVDYNYQKILVGLNEWLLIINNNQHNQRLTVIRMREKVDASIMSMCVANSPNRMVFVYDDDPHIVYFSNNIYSRGNQYSNTSNSGNISGLTLSSVAQAYEGQFQKQTLSCQIRSLTNVTGANAMLCTTFSEDDSFITITLGRQPIESEFVAQKPPNLTNTTMIGILHGYSNCSFGLTQLLMLSNQRGSRQDNQYQITCVILWSGKTQSNSQRLSYVITEYDTKNKVNAKIWRVPIGSGQPRACTTFDQLWGFSNGPTLQICDIHGNVFTCTEE